MNTHSCDKRHHIFPGNAGCLCGQFPTRNSVMGNQDAYRQQEKTIQEVIRDHNDKAVDEFNKRVAETVKEACEDAAVNHPKHYLANGLEVIDIIEAFKLGFRLGNAIKYILRAGAKGSRKQDLKKAIWYIQREIEKE